MEKVVCRERFRYCFLLIIAYSHYILFELITISFCLVPCLGPVVVDCSDGITQELGYLDAVGYAKSYQCEYAKLCIEPFRIFQMNLFIFSQQLVELFDKVGEELQEGLVEILIYV